MKIEPEFIEAIFKVVKSYLTYKRLLNEQTIMQETYKILPPPIQREGKLIIEKPGIAPKLLNQSKTS